MNEIWAKTLAMIEKLSQDLAAEPEDEYVMGKLDAYTQVLSWIELIK